MDVFMQGQQGSSGTRSDMRGRYQRVDLNPGVFYAENLASTDPEYTLMGGNTPDDSLTNARVVYFNGGIEEGRQVRLQRTPCFKCCSPWARCKLCCCRSRLKYSSVETRGYDPVENIAPNKGMETKFVDNRMYSTEATGRSLCFEFLIQQFSKASNLYFTVVCLLQFLAEIPGFDINPTKFYSTAIPFGIVLLNGFAFFVLEFRSKNKEDLKDFDYPYVRVKHDYLKKMRESGTAPTTENLGLYYIDNQETILSNAGEVLEKIKEIRKSPNPWSGQKLDSRTLPIGDDEMFEAIPKGEILVGDVVLARGGDVIPADMINLFGKTGKDKTGTVYMSLANINGETNLKERTKSECVSLSRESLQTPILCANNAKRVEDTRTVKQYNQDSSLMKREELILRDTVLDSNSNWMLGLVLYTGKESGANLAPKPAPKRSFLDRQIDVTTLYSCFGLLILVLILLFTKYGTATLPHSFLYPRGEYLPAEADSSGLWFAWGVLKLTLTFFLLFNGLIPVTLPVSLEFAQSTQASSIDGDSRFGEWGDSPVEQRRKTKEEKAKEAGEVEPVRVVRKPGMISNLGIVQGVVSDKTGTLTENVMEVAMFANDSDVFDINVGDGLKILYHPQYRPFLYNLLTNQQVTFSYLSKEERDKLDPFDRKMAGLAGESSEEVAILAVLREKGIAEITKDEKTTEDAIVYTVKYREYKAYARQLGPVAQDWSEPAEKITVHKIVPFSRTYTPVGGKPHSRNRMSVLAEIPGEGGSGKSFFGVFTKGQEVKALTSPNVEDPAQLEVADRASKLNLQLCTHLLRTLEFCGLELDQPRFKQLQRQLENKNAKENLDEMVVEVEVQMATEKPSQLHGIIGIKDELQPGVDDTITDLAHAGIKFTMCTGDRKATAIAIAENINMISTGAYVPQLNKEAKTMSDDDLVEFVIEALRTLIRIVTSSDEMTVVESIGEAKLKGLFMNEEGTVKQGFLKNQGKTTSIAIEGDVWFRSTALGDKQVEDLINELYDSEKITSIISCVMSPAHKQRLVEIFKKGEDRTILAIGDGGNDVPMLGVSSVGCAVRGSDGTGAERASDVAINRFRFLRPLLFIHGRYCFGRSNFLKNYTYYNNIVLGFILFLYCWFNGLSGTSPFQSEKQMLYNVTFTFLPAVIFSAVERDIPTKVALGHPELYGTFRDNGDKSKRHWFGWMCNGMFHSLLVFILCFVVPSMGLEILSDVWGMPALSGLESSIYTPDGRVTDVMIILSSVALVAVVAVVNLKLALHTRFWGVAQCVWYSLCVLCYFPIAFGLNYKAFDFKNLFGPLMSASILWILAFFAVVMILCPDLVAVIFLRFNEARRDNQAIEQAMDKRSELKLERQKLKNLKRQQESLQEKREQEVKQGQGLQQGDQLVHQQGVQLVHQQVCQQAAKRGDHLPQQPGGLSHQEGFGPPQQSQRGPGGHVVHPGEQSSEKVNFWY